MASTKTTAARSAAPAPTPAPIVEPSRGRVLRVYADRGFGFIRCVEGPVDDVGQDFFFHYTGIDDCHISELEEGGMVSFQATYVAKGKRAEHVRREGREEREA